MTSARRFPIATLALTLAVAMTLIAGACSSTAETVVDPSTAGAERYIEEPTIEPGEPEREVELIEPTPVPDVTDPIVEALIPVVISTRNHDRDAFTQGLEFSDGRLFESTGAPGAFVNSTTTIREVDAETGDVLRVSDFGTGYFGEGLTVVGSQIFQLSWLAQTAFVFDRDTFDPVREFTYETQGWGICYNGIELVMTDGSGLLYFRDPATFEIVRTVEVLRNGIPVSRLNELECVDGVVWSNVWQTTEILKIDQASGNVLGVVDAAGIVAEEAVINDEFVLNGIAYNPASDTYLITGKNWSSMYEVTFEPTPS